MWCLASDNLCIGGVIPFSFAARCSLSQAGGKASPKSPAKSDVTRALRSMSLRRKVTSVVVLAATGIGALSIFDDCLIFQECSKRALDKANSDPELKTILGENIEQGPWYAATMGVDNEGHSALCSFPVTGSLASGNLHLRAVRSNEKYKWLTPYLPGLSGGRWDVLVLEALVPTGIPPAHRRISLIHPDRRPKVGDGGGGGPCGIPSTIGHHEV